MTTPVITFSDFSFTYRSQAEPTLKNINLSIYKGEKVLIIGPSGSGKSTLSHCINGLVPFSYEGTSTGNLKISGMETKSMSLSALSKQVGTVLQDPDSQFIGLTVGEDIAFSLENDAVEQSEMHERVEQAAKLVGMELMLTKRLFELSGGQKQRVALAGVLVDDVDVLLFDEPLANLDPRAGKEAMELIDRIHTETDTTLIIIEHRLEDVLHIDIDRVIVINDGCIVGDMPPDELMVSPLLDECNIRKPLAIKALQYANSPLTVEDRPSQLKQLSQQRHSQHLVNWLNTQGMNAPQVARKPLLTLEQLSFGYTQPSEQLLNISFSVHAGEMISIVGPNGAGKSTLSKVISGFLKPSSGTITYNGSPINDDTIKERAEQVGLVLQNPNQMISKHMIIDEVAFGLKLRKLPPEIIEQRVNDALQVCGLYPFRNWPINALSFGQKKRVTIASILALQPGLLIVDEPTAGQDYKHYTEMMEFLSSLRDQGVGILMITHDMHLMMEYTTRALVLVNGRLEADISPARLMSDETLMEKAHLKETSLYTLAMQHHLSPLQMVERFISADKEARANGS
ncbi:ABC transporter ATP-binding protein [Aureibacillus halotolerans]|uniref:Energy-coupling factor transport system ATP-binding protein n=1 Tax=Aureibacillus halotolerans TaxID=1508390 RepID=A0A4R6UC11_9BACI|nr:ABC transporter ATP-binding protein [Aureibacillus halotolerans]TDQ42613.1 energy-coupling factor transport system ATP-binding protein [Aureibacillus halotolerans]